MKASVLIEKVKPENFRVYTNKKRKSRLLKRASPFILLTFFLIFLFPYQVITSGDILSVKLIIFPFVIANVTLVDFAIWNYLGGRKRWLIWLSETLISAGI